MTFFETLHIALLDLALHKFRSLLAALGIIFGVASVEAMVSISLGAQTAAVNRITALGVDNVIVRSVKPPDTATNQKQGDRQYILQYGLLRKDLDHVRETFPVRYAVGSRNMRTQIYTDTGRELDVSVVATEPDYLPLTRSKISRGRFITDVDQRTAAPIAVLGSQAARTIFSFTDPIDQFVKVETHYYRVVGILDNEAAVKDAGGDDINNQVFISMANAQANFGDISFERSAGASQNTNIQLDSIAFQVLDTADAAPLAARLQAYLEHTHKQHDYQFLVPIELIQQKAATQRIFTIVMASIAGLSLLIGGIGIMNIMLANIYDRRKEIGTRRALGARRADILAQFVLEAAALTTFGGLIGVGVGYLLAKIISTYADWPTIISPTAIALGLAISSLTGILFGLWPARQAARTNPIEALRAG
ncbi:MAG TPA: ABC transporter permease [Phycisphaerae bacterium]|nr:ABC transporter permease [Phycisphaerae bacterium]